MCPAPASHSLLQLQQELHHIENELARLGVRIESSLDELDGHAPALFDLQSGLPIEAPSAPIQDLATAWLDLSFPGALALS